MLTRSARYLTRTRAVTAGPPGVPRNPRASTPLITGSVAGPYPHLGPPGMRRACWAAALRRALLPAVRPHRYVLLGGLLAGILSAPLAADQPASATAEPPPARPPISAPDDELTEIIVQAREPRYVAPTRRDRIGRIWAPVWIDGKGPYRLVLDTGANRSAITTHTADELGIPPALDGQTVVTGFTGSATVPTVRVAKLEVGDVYLGPAELPVLRDVFGGAEGVLGIEGLEGRRIYADFTHDKLEISKSHGDRARADFTVVPLRVVHGLLVADVKVGSVRAKAIIDTGAQGTVGNIALRDALMRHPPRNAQRTDIIGVTLDVQTGDYMTMPDIDFGKMTVRNVPVAFGDMYLFQHWGLTQEPTLTLGMDLLGSFDVLIIDYARHELQIRVRNAPAPIGVNPF